MLYGTGFRAQNQAATATVGGTSVQVRYAGAQSSLAGLDQANLLLTNSLAGRGLVEVIFTVNGVAANTVQVQFR